MPKKIYLFNVVKYNSDKFELLITKAINAAISIKVIEPIFESQTKTKLGSAEMEPGGVTVLTFVQDFLKKHLDNFLHKNSAIADLIEGKIKMAEHERKAMSGVKK